MAGLDDLYQLLEGLQPTLDKTPLVFSTGANLAQVDLQQAGAIACIREAEGWTWVLPAESARDLKLPYETEYCRISLMVHSSLEALGLTATVSTLLTDAGIPANMIAGYYHDHLLVPVARAEQAQAILQDLSARARQASQLLQNNPEGSK